MNIRTTLGALAVLAGALLLASPAAAGTLNFKGLAWGDYSAFLADADDDVSGINGFQVRRIYLTFGHDLGDGFDGRVRLEMGQQALQETDGDSGDGDMVPSVKDAWLRWKYTEGHQAILGLSETPFLGFSQAFWGLRRIEKTVADLQRMGSTRDIGIALKGRVAEELGYHFMVGNGNSNNEEINQGKSVQLALHLDGEDRPFVAEVVGMVDFKGDLEPGDWATVKGLLGYRGDRARAGVEVAHQLRQDAGSGGDDATLTVASVFGVVELHEKADVFARVDRALDADNDTDTSYFLPIMGRYEHTVVMGGVDIALGEKVTLTPNVQAVIYGDDASGNSGPDATVIGRVTIGTKF